MNTGFPARFAEKIESMGVPRRKALEYAVMFVALCGIYYWHLVRDWKLAACRTEVEIITFSQLGVMMLKFLAFTAWPFALMAGLDGTWRSKDAGKVFLAAYVAANVLWTCKTGYYFCTLGVVIRVFPYVFCACLAHGIGAWLNRLRNRE